MPVIDFDTPITARDGTPLKEGEHVITLGLVCAGALEAPHRDDAEMGGHEKLRRKRLADRIYAGRVVGLTVEEIALLKTVTGRALSIYVAGVAWELLDPECA
ncbi:hypothetical protein [Ancylobacter sp. SL191]|uniref:hypothetical protein n=1 Tax=Ancylobacter sp. SL191 TaxID=2995166 RepID=UPI00226D83D4|nr:hypothetical protein [Ancylobacter sp. SL191]WAC26350.1 hypothetical protein OU996_15190 [Ancylobacter sp. SL191]